MSIHWTLITMNKKKKHQYSVIPTHKCGNGKVWWNTETIKIKISQKQEWKEDSSYKWTVKRSSDRFFTHLSTYLYYKWCHPCRVLTYIRSLLIEKDGHVSQNISILFPCVCSCACPPCTLQFSVRVITFLFFILCYS